MSSLPIHLCNDSESETVPAWEICETDIFELFFSPPATPLTASLPGTLPCRCLSEESLEEMSISPSFLNFNFYLCSVRERYVHVPVCVHACGSQSLLSVWCLS